MIKVKTLEIAGFQPTFKAMRYPKRSDGQSDSEFLLELSEYGKSSRSAFQVGEKDLKLCQTLIRAGDDHAKHMRGIMVWADIEAPDWFWDELCTYEKGVVKLPSSSCMHIEFKDLQGEELEKARDEQPRGVRYKRIYVISYQALRHIYHARKKHRLPSWRTFCKWIESLPLAEELICL